MINQKLEDFKKYIKGKSVALIGSGISNMSCVDLLLSYGAEITVRDKNPDPTYTPDGEGGADVRVLPILSAKGIKTRFGDDYLDDLYENVIIKTPAIRCDVPQIAEAVKNGARLTSESELFCTLCPCRIIAVTGSDGKTTTTTLIYKMLSAEAEKCGHRVFLGGNIGTPLFPLIESVSENDFAVLELSSFQLHTMKFIPYRAVITNISPNHLNWHTDMNEYAESKANIFRFQDENCGLVLNRTDGYTNAFAERAKAKVTLFSSKEEPDGDAVWLCGNDIYARSGGESRKVLSRDEIRIVGLHNVENYMAAIAATEGLVSDETVRKIAKEFPGVRHRIEEVCERGGVKYYNSSIDTTPSRTIAALNSFDRPPVVICGGSDKNLPLESLVDILMKKAKYIVLTGTTGVKLKALLSAAGCDKFAYEGDFKRAVKLAASRAEKGDAVLLSPAAASFDSFRNFERRGDFFCNIVKNL